MKQNLNLCQRQRKTFLNPRNLCQRQRKSFLNPRAYRVFQHSPSPRRSQHIIKDLWCKKGWNQPCSVIDLLSNPGLVSGSWARGYSASGLVLTEVQAQTTLIRVQHHLKPRFSWAVVQNKKSPLRVVLPVECGCSCRAWDPWDVEVDLWATCLWRKDCAVFV